MQTINNLNSSFWSRDFIALDQRQDGTLNLRVKTLNVFQQALRWLFGAYSNTIWNVQKATVLVNGLANKKEWKHVEKAITDGDLFEKVFKVAKKVLVPKDENTRNILVVGRSRSGKTTMIKMIKNIFNMKSEYKHTEDSKKRTIQLGDYKFKFLDTPGVLETLSNDGRKLDRNDDEILELIQHSVQDKFGGKEFNNVDTVIFTLTGTPGAVSNEDIAYINKYMPLLSNNTKKIIVFTHTEGVPVDKHNEIVEDTCRFSVMKNLMKHQFENGNNIHFSGRLKREDRIHEKLFVEQLENIYLKTEALIGALLPDTISKKEKKAFFEKRDRSLAVEIESFLDQKI